MIRVRFASIPSGHLTLAAARVALANQMHAIRRGGQFLLRFDDADQEHCRPEYVEAIRHDLAWLGCDTGSVLHQSERRGLYADAMEQLKQSGRLYPCFESEEELRAKRDHRLKRGQPAVYDRAMLSLTDAQRQAAEAGGKRPYWRFRLSDRTVEWHDLVLGACSVKLPSVSDPVVARADGTPLPILTSIVDDLALEISDVILGEDHVTTTAIQLDLREALHDAKAGVRFAHLPALADAEGVRPARRAASRTIRSLRNDGMEAMALAAALLQKRAEDLPESWTRDDLARAFDLRLVPREPMRFDGNRLLQLNRLVLANLPFAAVVDRLPRGATEAFWLAVRGKLDLLNEARGWWDVVAGTIVPPVIEDGRDIIGKAVELLPSEPWNDRVCTEWLGALSEATQLEHGRLLQPLRLALTGEDGGPELGELLPLMGRARAVNRLQIAASA